MSVSLTVQLVTTGGHIDQAASEQAFRTALSRRIAELETEQDSIAQATSELFDQFRGQPIPMPTLGSMVAQKLNAQPENHAVLSERVKAYVRDNSQTTGNEKAGTLVQNPNSLFVISKGKNGGVNRRSDMPSKA